MPEALFEGVSRKRQTIPSLFLKCHHPDIALLLRLAHVDRRAVTRQNAPRIELSTRSRCKRRRRYLPAGEIENTGAVAVEKHDFLAIGKPLRPLAVREDLLGSMRGGWVEGDSAARRADDLLPVR